MLLCVPSRDDGTLEAPLSSHFGRAPCYTLYDEESEDVELIENDGQHRGGTRAPPDIIGQTGADVLVVADLGRKAVDRFATMDIDVYCGADGTVRDAIDQYDAGALEAATPGGTYCEGHGHDHSHEH